MTRIFTFIAVMIVTVMAEAETFSYRFNSTPLPEAIQRIVAEHPELEINFIYNELENYKTSATVKAENVYDALRQTVGLNPVIVAKAKDSYYIEALQHGKYIYSGQAMGVDNEPVAAATVLILAPRDSTVITYGIPDGNGRFTIPCDRQKVIAKVSCLGYQTTYVQCHTPDVGTIHMAQQSVKLGEVKIEAQNAHLHADRTVYIPTQRQKNAAQTGTDLLEHMSIPQLGLMTGGNIVTNAGIPVAVFIDYLPASANDLQAMRVSDVKKVEYYESPSDPRLQGTPYVINFIMQRYEYGGYVKGFGHANLISFSEQLLGSVRLQYKNMTYDLMGYEFNMDNSHYGSDMTERFKLPQADGSIKEFERHSETKSSKTENQQYLAAFKATYTSDEIQASTQINASIDDKPHSDRSGSVSYTPSLFPASDFASTLDNRAKFIAYNGYYYFSLPRSNSLTLIASYVYSHTDQNSSYREASFQPILNGATDNTNQLNGDLKFSHGFGKYGNLLGFMRGTYEYNRTRYSGSANSFDKTKSTRIGIGVTYNVTVGNLYTMAGIGSDWDRLQFGDMVDNESSPWFDFSLQYTFREKHSLSAVFHYSSWAPSPSYKSENIIASSPFMKYTGNPNLTPNKNYDAYLGYTWLPDNNFNLGAYALGWMVRNRYTYDYEATEEGIIRTIKQPMGGFAKYEYGLNATARFLDRSLMLTGQVCHVLNHNGKPYYADNSHIEWHARVAYYLGNWNFNITYISDKAAADSRTGIWNRTKNDWYIAIGWACSDWNVKANFINFTRWNWRNARQEMHSNYYSTYEQIYNGSSHALVQLSATYTFGFGKKVKRDDEPSVSGTASSGILK